MVVIEMGKTLYVDKEVSNKARRIFQITEKSISKLVTDFFNKHDLESSDFKISEKVSCWAGIAKSDKSYKELRNEATNEKTKKYEDYNRY